VPALSRGGTGGIKGDESAPQLDAKTSQDPGCSRAKNTTNGFVPGPR
jgi:hypothetical protein